MHPTDIIPNSTGIRVHTAGTFARGAVDIYAPPGSEVLAAGSGQVVAAMPSPAVPGSWQIQGYMVRQDGKLVPFVLAHLQLISIIRPGEMFHKGDVLGTVHLWAASPRSTHAHVAFRRAGETRFPPPGNVLVLEAFKRFGSMQGAA